MTEEQLPAEQESVLEIKEGDIFFALATFISETGEAMNLVEGEKVRFKTFFQSSKRFGFYKTFCVQVHVLDWGNDDWWYVRKHLTEESGWVPAQYLKDEQA